MKEVVFVVGSKVRWTSQSQGYTTIKEGVVMAIVPRDSPPRSFIPYGYKLREPTGLPRTHRSYLVSASGHGAFLLWPRVKDLRSSRAGERR